MDTFGFDHWLSGSVNPELNTRNWSHFLYILGVAIFLILSDRSASKLPFKKVRVKMMISLHKMVTQNTLHTHEGK